MLLVSEDNEFTNSKIRKIDELNFSELNSENEKKTSSDFYLKEGCYQFLKEKGLNCLIGRSGSGKTYKVLEEVKRLNKNFILKNKAVYYPADIFFDKLVNSELYDLREEFFYYLKYYYDFVFVDNAEYFLNKNQTRRVLIYLAKLMEQIKDNLVLVITWDVSKKEEFFKKFYSF